MSTMDTSSLARIMLGGFGQGANMVTNAAQILDQRARAAQVQQRYAEEVEYRRRQDQAAAADLLAQQTALANFAENQGIFGPTVDPMAYGPQQPAQSGAPSPLGPYQPGMEPAPPIPGAMGLDRATIMGMDPASARSLITGAVKHRRDLEMAQFKADIDDQIERQKMAREMASEASFMAQARHAGFSEADIQRSLLARRASSLGTPAGVVGDVFGNQPYQKTPDDYRTALGMPGPTQPSGYGPYVPGTEPVAGSDMADVFARDQTSFTEAARLMPKPEDAAGPSIDELAAQIKMIVPNVTDDQARAIVTLRQNDMPFGLPDANITGQTRTQVAPGDKEALSAIQSTLTQARSNYADEDDLVRLERQYREQFERTYGQPFPMPIDYSGLAASKARVELGKDATREEIRRKAAEIERGWRAGESQGNVTQGDYDSLSRKIWDEMGSGATEQQVLEELKRRLGNQR